MYSKPNAALLRFEIPIEVSEADVLDCLHGSIQKRGHRLALDRGLHESNWGRQWEGADHETIGLALAAIREKAVRKVQDAIDQWIDSGMVEGGEAPGQRNVKRAPAAHREALAFWRESQNVIERETPRLAPKFDSSDPEATEWKARRIIATVLFSSLAFRIAKCRYRKCGRYFMLSGERRKKIYEHGLFCCPKHNRAESAMRSVQGRRSAATKRLIDYAAQESLRIGRKADDDEIKNELLKKLNQWIKRDRNQPRDRIKVNWITHHWKEIQKRKGELSRGKN
jgi:hypothetical protein